MYTYMCIVLLMLQAYIGNSFVLYHQSIYQATRAFMHVPERQGDGKQTKHPRPVESSAYTKFYNFRVI